LWHVGLLVQIVALSLVGWLETEQPAALFRGDAAVRVLYSVRAAGGALMLLGSARWLGTLARVLAGEPAANRAVPHGGVDVAA